MEKHSIRSNIHTHTLYSDGKESVRENIERAISLGFLSIGISDHSYTKYDEGCCILKNAELEYYSHVKKLMVEYKDKIEVYCGIELDYYTEQLLCKYDYVIASVHGMIINNEYYPIDLNKKDQLGIIKNFFKNDKTTFANKYYELVKDNIKKNNPDVVGHFDLINKYSLFDDESEEYRNIALSALYEIMKYCSRFEVNTGAMARGLRSFPYPSEFIIREIKKLGGTFVISSDAHKTLDLDYAFSETAEYLKELGVTQVERLTKHGFVSDIL